jgi:hypothetical protein
MSQVAIDFDVFTPAQAVAAEAVPRRSVAPLSEEEAWARAATARTGFGAGECATEPETASATSDAVRPAA